LLARHGTIENFPPTVLADDQRALALLFKDLATLRTDAPLFRDVDELRWQGPTDALEEWAKRVEAAHLLERSRRLEQSRGPGRQAQSGKPGTLERSRKPGRPERSRRPAAGSA